MFSMSSNLRNALGILIIPVICLLSVGCGSDNNLAGPEAESEPAPEIKTPKYMIVKHVSARAFPHKKPNGDTWDWNPVSILDEFPDVFARVGVKGKDASYRSETADDAQSTDRPDLSTAHSSSPQKLPYKLSYSQSYTFSMHDDDGLTKDDKMGEKTIKPSGLYLKDNATSFNYTLECTNGVKLQITGSWEY